MKYRIAFYKIPPPNEKNHYFIEKGLEYTVRVWGFRAKRYAWEMIEELNEQGQPTGKPLSTSTQEEAIIMIKKIQEVAPVYINID